MDVRRLFLRLALKDDRLTWAQHFAVLRAFHKRERDIRACPVLSATEGTVIAYVANFKRPQNIDLIVHALLASPSISQVIVSNNNPACDLARWFRSSSDRVVILEHAQAQSCSMRHIHLRAFPSPFYLILDDDVFLHPTQIHQLCDALAKDPSAPHGLYGQQWEHDHFRGGVQNQEGSIDVISRVYAFTAAHHQEFFRLSTAVGIVEGHPNWSLSRFDDLLLSFSGSCKPHMHDLGTLVDCSTQGMKGIATWRESGFHREREEMYRQLIALKPLA